MLDRFVTGEFHRGFQRDAVLSEETLHRSTRTRTLLAHHKGLSAQLFRTQQPSPLQQRMICRSHHPQRIFQEGFPSQTWTLRWLAHDDQVCSMTGKLIQQSPSIGDVKGKGNVRVFGN